MKRYNILFKKNNESLRASLLLHKYFCNKITRIEQCVYQVTFATASSHILMRLGDIPTFSVKAVRPGKFEWIYCRNDVRCEDRMVVDSLSVSLLSIHEYEYVQL